MMSLMKTHSTLRLVNNLLVDLPSPNNFTTMWNFGSMLGLCLVLQIMTGLFLSMHYCADVEMAFSSVSHISRDVNYGWLLRMLHANGASLFFICLYLHIGRGLYYNSYYYLFTWMIGVTILLMTMATAFLGYVLPWGQMSFWGATVITNLFSALPYIGEDLVQWMWGGFAVDNATLTRFYSLHFLLPFLLSAMSMIHLMYLHETGSSNPLGLNSNFSKIMFHPYYTLKDLVGFILGLMFLLSLCMYNPWLLGDPENFIPANLLVTPVHIQPEWYFLMAYAILRSIPNKLGGVLALAFSVIILYFCPLMKQTQFRGYMFYPLNKMYFWYHINIIFLLTWIGARPVEEPYVMVGQILTIFYFLYYFLSVYMSNMWDKILT